MFEGLNMGDLGKILEETQKQAKAIQDETAAKTFRIKSGAGMVEIVGNGKGEVVDLKIDDSLLEDKEALQILLISAINDLWKMVESEKARAAVQLLGESFQPFGKGNQRG